MRVHTRTPLTFIYALPISFCFLVKLVYFSDPVPRNSLLESTLGEWPIVVIKQKDLWSFFKSASWPTVWLCVCLALCLILQKIQKGYNTDLSSGIWSLWIQSYHILKCPRKESRNHPKFLLILYLSFPANYQPPLILPLLFWSVIPIATSLVQAFIISHLDYFINCFTYICTSNLSFSSPSTVLLEWSFRNSNLIVALLLKILHWFPKIYYPCKSLYDDDLVQPYLLAILNYL